MLLNLLTGLPVMLLCMTLQAAFLILCLRHFVRFKKSQGQGGRPIATILQLSWIMTLLLLGNFLQMVVWAWLFLMLGEFNDFAAALYHSGVNFATLGYGDIVMTEKWRLLGPLEASNGILMFGVSTATMTAAVINLLKDYLSDLK